MESIKVTTEFEKTLRETSTIKNGEVVLKHLTEDEIKCFIQYNKKMNSLKDELQRTKNKFFEEIERDVLTEESISTGVRSNGETLILVKSSLPDSIDGLMKGISKGLDVSIGSCKFN